jgi:hypothetical protein
MKWDYVAKNMIVQLLVHIILSQIYNIIQHLNFKYLFSWIGKVKGPKFL